MKDEAVMTPSTFIPKAAASESSSHLAQFEDFERSVSGTSPGWLRAIRTAGIAHFAEQGFPKTRDEEWRFTNVEPVAAFPFRPAIQAASDGVGEKDLRGFSFGGMPAHRLVFINGHFAPRLSTGLPLPDGARLSCLAAGLHSDAPLLEKHLARYARYADNAFVALNTAFIQDGALLYLPPRAELAEPVHLLFVQTEAGLTTSPRNLIIAERSSQMRVVEHYVSLVPGAYFTNAVTEIVAGENAVIEHCKVQTENPEAFHLAAIQAQQSAHSRVISHSISLGARLARSDIRVVLAGVGIDSILNGLFFASDDQLVDHHTVADHVSAHCSSHEFYHGILAGRARGVFNGKIFVRPGAQKTDAKQTSRNLLLTDTATIDAKPQLEIFADDVKCTHGATVGQLDEQALFYLRSRGLPPAVARDMLIHAFASDILNRISIEPVRAALEQVLFAQLEQQPYLHR